MDSESHRFRNQREEIWAEPVDISSDVSSRLQSLKRSIVMELFLQHGSTWNEIHTIREKWAISPTVGLPPQIGYYLHYPKDGWPDEYNIEGEQTSEWIELAGKWDRELYNLVRRLVPEAYRPDLIDATGWASFLSACVLFDPPEKELLLFANLGGLLPRGLSPAGDEAKDFGIPPHIMQAPPIRTLADHNKATWIESWFWERIIQRLGDKLNKVLDTDVQELIREVMQDSPDLFEKRKDLRERENPVRHYIAVYEHTTEADVRRAFRLISNTLFERSDRASSRRDSLTAIQCAILYDRHNGRDPQDSRRKKWTYEKLAKKLGLPSSRSAEAHILEGRQLLKDKS